MQAIKLSKKNLDAILSVAAIDPKALKEMTEEYDTHTLGDELYFIPHFESKHVDYEDWMTVPREYFEEHSTYDASKIDTQFVDVTEPHL